MTTTTSTNPAAKTKAPETKAPETKAPVVLPAGRTRPTQTTIYSVFADMLVEAGEGSKHWQTFAKIAKTDQAAIFRAAEKAGKPAASLALIANAMR